MTEPVRIIVPGEVPMRDLVPGPIVSGKVICPFHPDTRPSCHLYPDHFHCFACGAHGDQIAWLMKVDGLDYAEAVETLQNWAGPRLPAPPDDDDRTRACALRLWDEAVPIAGTLAEQYLINRRIDVDALPEQLNAALRFHPKCPFGPGTRHPCLIALFRDVTTDAPTGIHRIALTQEAQKIDRRMLGRWPGARAIKLWPVESSLVIGEGIETVLAAATRITHNGAPLRPAWAIGTAGGIARFPIVDGVEHLIVLVDNDFTGTIDARTCALTWSAAGRTASLLTPYRPGADFNDLARETV